MKYLRKSGNSACGNVRFSGGRGSRRADSGTQKDGSAGASLSQFPDTLRYLIHTAILLAVLARFAGASEPKTSMSADQAFEQLAGYDYGQDDEALRVLELHVVRYAKDAAHKAQVAQRLASILSKSDTSKAARIFICKQLVVVGTEAQVPILAKMLEDPDTAEIARYTLDAIRGEASLVALRGAVGRLKGAPLVGVINSLGIRRDEKSVDAVIRLLGDSDPQIVAAAAEALGKIGTTEAATALMNTKAPNAARTALHNAQLQCAERLTAAGDPAVAATIYRQVWESDGPPAWRVAGLLGLARVAADKATPVVLETLASEDPLLQGTAARLAVQLPGANVTAALVERLDGLDPTGQVFVLNVLADRNDRSAAEAVSKRIDHQDETVRTAAVAAIGKLGDASTVEPLAKIAATSDGAMQHAARTSLARLAAPDVDAKLIAMAVEGDTAVRMEVFRALAARGTGEAAPVLIKAAAENDAQIRVAAFEALAAVAQADSYAKLVELLVAAPTPKDAAAAERAVVVTGSRLDATERLGPVIAALDSATVQAKMPLLRVLREFGGAEALEAVRAQLDDSDPAVQDAAVRALAGWPDTSAADDLLKIAKGADNPVHRVLALRGYMRLVGEVKQASARLKMLDAVLPIATTVQSKQMLLAALSEVADPGALHVAAKFLDDSEVHAEAAVATLKIGRAALTADPAAVRAAMRKLMDTTKDQAVAQQAAALDEEALKVPSPTAIQQALRYDKKRSDAQKTALAKRAPQGCHLACYLDCGPDAADGAKDGPLLRLVAGTAYIWGDSLRAADGRFGSIFFDGQQVTFEASGLDPKKSYQIGFTWWDYDHNTRAQSVWLATDKGDRETKVLDKTKLPSGANKQAPDEKALSVPPEFYTDGSLRIVFRNEASPNVVVSELWLWESDAER